MTIWMDEVQHWPDVAWSQAEIDYVNSLEARVDRWVQTGLVERSER